MINETVNEENIFLPFESIALCFSGGGFRAAAYCLGTLSYINRLKLKNGNQEIPLLNKVKFTASTSGGTIANLLYSSYLFQFKNEREAFYKCFKKLYTDMKSETLLSLALDNLADDGKWDNVKTNKQRNIINSFAKVYDSNLFYGQTFDIFWREQFQKDYSVCFNATEFKRGLSFRFLHESDGGIEEKNGNKFIYFDPVMHHITGKIKLADILAASSCFPAGFEPLIFPNDFAYVGDDINSDLTVDQLKTTLKLQDYDLNVKTIKDPIGLMDGGVDDNQALYSVMQADQRRINQNKASFSLIMINDVTSYFMTPYEVNAETEDEWGKENINQYLGKLASFQKWYSVLPVIFTILTALSVASILFRYSHLLSAVGYFFLGISALGVTILVGINQLKKKSQAVKFILNPQDPNLLRDFIQKKTKHMFSDAILTKLLTYLKRAKLANLHQIVIARLNSVVTMAVEVNLKQVRRLIFSLFYENKIWDNKRLPNFIYELSHQNIPSRNKRIFHPRPDDDEFLLSLEDKNLLCNFKTLIPSIAEEARLMGTTLWFGKDDSGSNKLDKIIQCGQFTTCVNLLEYTLVLKSKINKGMLHFPEEIIQQLTFIEKDLKDDWERFTNNPEFFFIEEIKEMNKNIYDTNIKSI